MVKTILVNAYLALNLGDDLFLKILFDRYPNVKWVINTGDSRYKKVFSKYDNVEIRVNLFHKIGDKLGLFDKNEINFKKYDAGLYIGGSLFMESGNWRNSYNRLKYITDNFRKENKEYFILGCNFGPFKSEEFKQVHKEIFLNCTEVCFREDFSYKIFNELDNVRVHPDIVFQLEQRSEKKSKTLGISVINLSDREELSSYQQIYNEKIKEIVERSIQNNIKVTFFSFCEEQGDMKAINNIIGMIDKKYHGNINIVNYKGDIEEFLYQFSSMENIIATRFHAFILSQVFKQGLYPIIYSDKTLNVLKDINLDKEYMKISEMENLDVNYLLDIIADNKLRKSAIFDESKKQFEGLDKYVENK